MTKLRSIHLMLIIIVLSAVTMIALGGCGSGGSSFTNDPQNPLPTSPTPPLPPQSLQESLEQNWTPVLGDAGPATMDKLVTDFTPPAFQPQDADELVMYAENVRTSLISKLGIQLDKEVISWELQRQVDTPEYTIEVIKLETTPDFFTSINVYIPKGLELGTAPLVITPTATGLSVWHEGVQTRAGNLAKMGMVVIVTEGYTGNGSRTPYEYNRYISYSREMIGLPGYVNLYLQELIQVINWAIGHYSEIDPTKIGACGYSYGGNMVSFISLFDTRINAISIPATYFGGDTDNFQLTGDIWIESALPDHVWSAPLAIPILPINTTSLLIYPRYFHTTAGQLDSGAHPSFVSKVMAYAEELYSLASFENRLLYREDEEDHNYGRSRRQDTYEWFAYSLLGELLGFRAEQSVQLFTENDLKVNLTGTKTTWQELNGYVNQQIQDRYAGGSPSGDVISRVNTALDDLYPIFTSINFESKEKWRITFSQYEVIAYEYQSPQYSVPVFVFTNEESSSNGTLLYLPQSGTYQELEAICRILEEGQYRKIFSLDYPGIGELKSNRTILHTYCRYFMNNDPSIPKLNVEIIRSFLLKHREIKFDVYTSYWSSSFYSLFLKKLEPDSIGKLYLSGIPNNELELLKIGKKIPDLLLWGKLFGKITAREIIATIPDEDTVVHFR